MPSVDLGVVSQFLHPPLGSLTRELVVGNKSGTGSIDRPAGPVGVDAFGVLWSFFTVPINLGYRLGNPIEYEMRMIQLAVIHTLRDSHEVVSQLFDANVEGYMLFDVAIPTRVEYTILPGVEITFHWLIL